MEFARQQKPLGPGPGIRADLMNIMLFPIGSAGDVHPFIGLSLALARRGHRVTFFFNDHFQALIDRVAAKAELECVPFGTKEELLRVAGHPDLWHPTRSFGLLFREGIARAMRPQYAEIAARFVPGQTVVVANCLGFGARIAQEKLGVPLVTVHLQPSVLWSEYESPCLPGILMRGPRWLKRLQFGLGETLVIDRATSPETNRFRRELGLGDMRRTTRWWHSPDKILCLFPEWFAPKQPDWPPNVYCTEFPLWDGSSVTDFQPKVERFMKAGTPPIVFTPGTGNLQASPFFAAAAEACSRLGRRGLFLTPFREQVPARLPDCIGHFDYVPLSRILPLSAALVHHGGIGTVSQGLSSGVPQLVMPLSHDQPDNADRLKRLGVGDSLKPSVFQGPKVATVLHRLLSSKSVQDCCRQVKSRFTRSDSFGRACQIIEQTAISHQ